MLIEAERFAVTTVSTREKKVACSLTRSSREEKTVQRAVWPLRLGCVLTGFGCSLILLIITISNVTQLQIALQRPWAHNLFKVTYSILWRETAPSPAPHSRR